MKVPDKIYLNADAATDLRYIPGEDDSKIMYICKDTLLELVKLAYGKVSIDPFSCSDAFEELIEKINEL